MTETNHNANKLCQAPARAQQQQGPPCLTSRHRQTLSGAGRRAYGDGETTAGLQRAGPSINDLHRQSSGTRKQASTQSAALTKKKRWKPFSLDKLLQERSHRPLVETHVPLRPRGASHRSTLIVRSWRAIGLIFEFFFGNHTVTIGVNCQQHRSSSRWHLI